MRLLWSDEGWEDYLSWQSGDNKTLRRLNKIINPEISDRVARNDLMKLLEKQLIMKNGKNKFRKYVF